MVGVSTARRTGDAWMFGVHVLLLIHSLVLFVLTMFLFPPKHFSMAHNDFVDDCKMLVVLFCFLWPIRTETFASLCLHIEQFRKLLTNPNEAEAKMVPAGKL